MVAAGDELLVLDQVNKRFGGLKVIIDFDFVVHEEEIVGLIGPNGAGKSTVFNLITSIYTPTAAASRSRARRSPGWLRTRSVTWGSRGPISWSGRSSRCRCSTTS